MWETGRLAKFREQWLYLVNEDPCPLDSNLPSFDLNNVTLPFYALIFGSLFALFILWIENLLVFAFKNKP
jgi:hypothetical protein